MFGARAEMKIYIACALTHVPRDSFQEYASFIHRLANAAKSVESVSQVKYALVDSDPQLAAKPFSDRARLCYLWDREMVEEADLVIAELTYPSTGLGIELQVAQAANIPIVACFSDRRGQPAGEVTYENPDRTTHNLQIGEGFVTLMALGLPAIFALVRYSNPSDGVAGVARAIETFSRP